MATKLEAVAANEAREATMIEVVDHIVAPVLNTTYAVLGTVGRSAVIDGPKSFWAAFTKKDSTAPKTKYFVLDGKVVKMPV